MRPTSLTPSMLPLKMTSRGFPCSSLFRGRSPASAGSADAPSSTRQTSPPPARPRRREALPLRPVREGLQLRLESPKASENSHWREALRVQGMRENLRLQLLPHSPPEAAPQEEALSGAVRSAPPAAAPLWCPLWLWPRTCSFQVVGLQALGRWVLSPCPRSRRRPVAPSLRAELRLPALGLPALTLSPCPRELAPRVSSGPAIVPDKLPGLPRRATWETAPELPHGCFLPGPGWGPGC